MQYKQFGDLKLSHLGMGCMRLPVAGENGPIDEEKASKIIEYAYEHGVNYFDTGFRYHKGDSQRFTGSVLSQYPRDTWNIAAKFPGHMLRFEGDKIAFTGFGESRLVYFDSIEQIFQQQLDECGVEYFDFFLMHGLAESNFDFYSDPKVGIVDYLQSEKKAGRIKHFGFSTHGRADAIDHYLTYWKGLFEVVQIQINYLDWTLQSAKEKYDIVVKHGAKVIAMEPVRGGKLANLPEDALARLKAVRPDDSPAAWAFRFLQGLPDMQVILSGMTTMEQVIENVELFSKEEPVNEEEKALLLSIAQSITNAVPCTACQYCYEGCPQNLEIAKLISMFNEASHDRGIHGIRRALQRMDEKELPAACIACGVCAGLCPQQIDIPDVLKKFDELIKSASA